MYLIEHYWKFFPLKTSILVCASGISASKFSVEVDIFHYLCWNKLFSNLELGAVW